MSDFLNFVLAATGERPIEIIAVALGLANITLLIRRSIWNYPFGILMVVLYSKVFFDAKLYSDAMLQIFFFTVQIYGWIIWARHRDTTGHVVVTRLQKTPALIYFVCGILGTGALGTLMARLTDASFPYWDASIAAMSVIAQILLARRRLENWLVWIAVDISAITLYWIKGLQPTAALYAVFLLMSAAGFIEWRRAWRRGEAVT